MEDLETPDYFLIDLPDEADLNPKLIQDACQTLKENRMRFLLERSTESLITALSSLAEVWLDPLFPFRQTALRDGPDQTGFPLPTLEKGLDHFFSQLTGENLQSLITQDLGHWQRFDRPIGSQAEIARQRMAMVHGPELIFHITAGRIPTPTLGAMVLGVLARSAQFVKCPSKAAFLPRLFAHSLYDREPKLAACLEIVEWPGGTRELEDPIFAEADCVCATGKNETIQNVRDRMNPRSRFMGYGHRVSFAFIAKEAITTFNAKTMAADAVEDIAAWNQAGCLSPHVIYVEKKGSVSPDHFADLLAGELEKKEQIEPRGEISVAEAADITTRRDCYELRATHSLETRCWSSLDSTAWTVVYEDDPRFQLSCLNRFIYVKSVETLDEALAGAEPMREHVSTIGLASAEETRSELVARLARWGALRVCRLGQMQKPSLLWRHDGRPSLAEMVTWTDWEL